MGESIVVPVLLELWPHAEPTNKKNAMCAVLIGFHPSPEGQ
jgi:hypothetical protein